MIKIRRQHLRSRRALLLGTLLTMGCAVLWAQPNGPSGPLPDGPPPDQMQQSSGPSVKRELKSLTQFLTLSSAQQGQVNAILTEKHQRMETLFDQSRQDGQDVKSPSDSKAGSDETTGRDAMETSHAATKAIRDEASVKISAILTEEQKVRFEVWEQKREATSKRQDNDDAPPPPPDGDPPPDGGGGGPPGI